MHNAESQQNQDVNQETRENVLDKTLNQGQTTQDKSSATAQPLAISDDKEVEMIEDGFIEVKSKRKNKKTTVNQDDLIFKFPTIIYPDESNNINTTQKTKQDTTARQKWPEISPLGFGDKDDFDKCQILHHIFLATRLTFTSRKTMHLIVFLE